MKLPILVTLLLLQLSVSSAKIYQPCELAEFLHKNGFKSGELAQWVCLAKFSSGFNSNAIEGPLKDKSYNYGIFQINEQYCKKGSKLKCAESCSVLRSDELGESARCALKIYKKLGFNAWPAWTNDCEGRDVTQYTKKCSLKSRIISE